LLTAPSLPLILAQPQNQQIVVGSDATFTVNASSVSALGYQWKFDGTNLSSASTSVLTITNVLAANAGSYQLVVTNANGAVTSVVAILTVIRANPVVTAWPTASAITYGQTLAASALSGGTATPAGSFAWTPPATAPGAGTALQSVIYMPTDTTDFNSATGSVSLVVTKGTPIITWTNPSSIMCNTPLSCNQLNATASVPGSFAYTPTNGTVLNTGTNTLWMIFTPTDMADYSSVTDSVSLVVLPAGIPPVIPVVGHSDGWFTFTWSATPGQMYQVQYVTNLSQTNWTTCGSTITATNSAPTASDSITNLQRFYRVVLLLP
jgi:hypothetical protein